MGLYSCPISFVQTCYPAAVLIWNSTTPNKPGGLLRAGKWKTEEDQLRELE